MTIKVGDKLPAGKLRELPVEWIADFPAPIPGSEAPLTCPVSRSCKHFASPRD